MKKRDYIRENYVYMTRSEGLGFYDSIRDVLMTLKSFTTLFISSYKEDLTHDQYIGFDILEIRKFNSMEMDRYDAKKAYKDLEIVWERQY